LSLIAAGKTRFIDFSRTVRDVQSARGMRFPATLAALSLVACSGSNFDLVSAPADSGSTATPTEDTTPVESDAEPIEAEAGASDGGVTTPPCNTTMPAPACTAPGSEYAPQIQYGASSDLTPLVDHNTSHAISYVTERAGRHEKMILMLRRLPAGGATPGRLTLTAYYTPCAGVHVPLGKSRSFDAANVYDGNVSFYFNDDPTFLPLLPAGTRLTFVLSTDSTAYNFQLVGSPTGATPPSGLQWWVRKGTGSWERPGPALPSVQAWLRYCPG
jgi:hypothetical protein